MFADADSVLGPIAARRRFTSILTVLAPGDERSRAEHSIDAGIGGRGRLRKRGYGIEVDMHRRSRGVVEVGVGLGHAVLLGVMWLLTTIYTLSRNRGPSEAAAASVLGVLLAHVLAAIASWLVVAFLVFLDAVSWP